MQKIGFCERYMLTTKVLNRTKELTRRLEKALERAVSVYEKKWGKPFSIVSQYYDKGFDKIGICTPNEPIYLSTRYKLGEVVAVAQAYKDIEEYNPESYEDVMLDQGTICESSHPYSHLMRSGGWDNKMFVRPDLMPHQIKIMGVRIERLQDITDDDCVKEGITKGDDEGSPVYWIALPTDIGWKEYRKRAKEVSRHTKGGLYSYFYNNPREAFAALINRPGVGRKGLWESNSWVVVYTFKLIK